MPKHLRPRVLFTPEIGEAILDRLAAGEPLLRICGPRREAGMPDRVTVHQWLRKDQAFYGAYVRARGIGAAAVAEEIVEIADGREPDGGDVIEHRVAFGRQEPGQMPVRATAEQRSVGRDWLRITARRWLAGVMASAAQQARREASFDARAATAGAEAPAPEWRPGLQDDRHKAARIAAIFDSARRRMIAEGEVAEGDPDWQARLRRDYGQS